MMKTAMILFIGALFTIVSGISYNLEGPLDVGRILLCAAVICVVVGMLASLAEEPQIKSLFHRTQT